MLELWYNLRSALPGLWKQRWWGLAAAVISGIAASLGVLAIPERYAASARVYVDTQSILKPLMSGLAVQPNLDQQVSLMARTLISRPNAERVVRMADLDLAVGSPAERERAIDELIKNIKLTGGGNNLYTIEYQNRSMDAARKVVQSLMTIFVESNLGDKRRDSAQAQKFIEEQITVYEKRLLAAEAALKTFKLRNLAIMPNLAQDYVTRANDAQKEVQLARLGLRQAEDSRAAVRQQLLNEKPMIATIDPTVPTQVRRASQLELRVAAVRQRAEDLSQRFTEAFPELISTRKLLAQLEEQLAAERQAIAAAPAQPAPATTSIPNKVYQDLRMSLTEAESQVASQRAKLADAEARLQEARNTAKRIPEVEAEYAQLNRDYDINKKNYEQLVERRASAQMSGNMDSTAGVGEFRVVDPPRVAPNPVFPNRPLLLAGALVLSIGVGFGAMFLAYAGKPRFYDLRALRQVTDLPIFGAISLVDGLGSRRTSTAQKVLFSTGSVLYLAAFGALIGFFTLQSLAR